jgi:hypothetical protein
MFRHFRQQHLRLLHHWLFLFPFLAYRLPKLRLELLRINLEPLMYPEMNLLYHFAHQYFHPFPRYC